MSLTAVHAAEAAALEHLRPQGVKRPRGHSLAKGFPWGGFTAVQQAIAYDAKKLQADAQLTYDRACVAIAAFRQPVYVSGRYVKRKRGVPQSPWFEDDACTRRVGPSSVQVRLPHISGSAMRACFAAL